MKEKRTGIILIIFGGVLAAVVGFLAFTLASAAERPNAPTESIVVATQDIPERTVVPPNALAVKTMPVEVVPPGAVRRMDEAVGRMTLVRVQAGEVILVNKLADTKGQSGLSFTLERGKVVVTFPASNIIGLGLVRAGDSVDLLVTYKPSANKSATPQQGSPETLLPNVTQTTMQNLKVLTIGPLAQPNGQQQQQGQPNQAAAALVSFAVEPQDALFLKSIKDAENLVVEMALRSAQDDQIHRTEPVSFQDVLSRYGITAPSQPGARR